MSGKELNPARRIEDACTKLRLITRTEFSFETCSVLGAQALHEEPGFLQECTRSRGRLTTQGLRTCCCEVPGACRAAALGAASPPRVTASPVVLLLGDLVVPAALQKCAASR